MANISNARPIGANRVADRSATNRKRFRSIAAHTALTARAARERHRLVVRTSGIAGPPLGVSAHRATG